MLGSPHDGGPLSAKGRRKQIRVWRAHRLTIRPNVCCFFGTIWTCGCHGAAQARCGELRMRASDNGFRPSCNHSGNRGGGSGGGRGSGAEGVFRGGRGFAGGGQDVRWREPQQPADFLWELARRPWSAGGGRAAWAGRAARGRGAGDDAGGEPGEALLVSRSRVTISAISSINAISAEESRSPPPMAAIASVSPRMKLANVSTGVGGGVGTAPS